MLTVDSSPQAPATDDLVDLLLRQQQATAVDRFSHLHEQRSKPAATRHYRDLIPLSAPLAGEQYAFEVDLDACSGCKACVTACHHLNGLDEGEIWRTVGLLHGGTSERAVLQHVTTSCHHCIDPACLDGCPAKAYEKDPVTGVVRHLDDQCIGCQYCILKCPYDAPKYNPARGIVRKCDLCQDRLAANEPPACVEACPSQAIRIRIVDQQAIAQASESNQFLPGAPEPEATLPTTVYESRRPLPRNLLPADYYSVRPQHSHNPLVVMLVLTQLCVGAFTIDQLLYSTALGALAAATGVAGVWCSVMVYADLEESDVLVLIGANLCVAHPIMWQHVCRNPHRPEIIVVDPRTTETAMAATEHLAIRGKSDLELFYGVANILIQENFDPYSKQPSYKECAVRVRNIESWDG